MPHPVVHEWFKASIPAKAVGTPFQETIGAVTSTKGLPEIWATLEYDTASIQRLSVGVPALHREYGTATAVFLGKAGRGPAALLAVGQAFADAMRDTQTPLVEASGITGMLRVENVSPPSPEPYEDGNWLLCSVACVYTYDSVRGAVVADEENP